ncbi:Nose resistant to fluoxetine protein 6 [Fragariocoptes setiger]|uniref:Nose resistant to fluoxetine protein 6 n=1 Tax=Fragariocoptes setiger TaxID=1670756 RepID=A0ABQ7S718_9ACAR|nr:Nose resistant to fluoxetine protein 6 [Fragariocoptes setiger]
MVRQQQSAIAVLLVVCAAWCLQLMSVVTAGRTPETMSPELNYKTMVTDIRKYLDTGYKLLNNASFSIDFQDYVRGSFVSEYRLPGIELIGIHEYDNDLDKLRSSGVSFQHSNLSRAEINQLCASKLQLIIDQLNTSAYMDTLSNYHLFNLLDSWGKPETGFLRGNRFWLGNYDQCIDSFLEGEHAHYCLASLTWNNNKWPSHTNNLPLQRYNSIKTGVCLPYVCDTLAANTQHDKLMEIFRLTMGQSYTRNMSINSVYCLPDKQSPLTRWTESFLASSLVIFVAFWLFIVGVCTLTDTVASKLNYGEPQLHLSPLVKCFSLNRAIRSLLPKRRRAIETTLAANNNNSDNNDNKQQHADMKVLDGLKSLALVFVVTAHTWLLQPVSLSPFQAHLVGNTMFGRLLTTVLPGLAVNIFFTTTGIVTSYTIFKTRLSAITSVPFWLVASVHRYMRIIPVWLLAFWMMKCLKYSGSGPLWDYGTSNYTNVRLCEQESWLSVVLLGASLRSPQEHCFVVGWYLADDVMFALFVSPIYCVLLHKLTRVAYTFVPVSIIIGTMYQIYCLGGLDIDLTVMTRTDLQMTSMVSLDVGFLYSSPIVRLPFFIIGLAFGHVMILHEWTFGLDKLTITTCRSTAERWATNLMKIFSFFGTKLGATIIILGAIFTTEIIRSVPIYFESLDTTEVARFLSCPLFYICSIVFVLIVPPLLMHRLALSRLLVWPVWTPVSRIALSVLVTHPAIVQYYYMSYTQTIQTPPFIMVQTSVYLIVVSYFVGFVFYLLFEYPLKSINDTIMCLLITNRSSSNSKSKASNGKQQTVTAAAAPSDRKALEIVMPETNSQPQSDQKLLDTNVAIDLKLLRPE